MDSSPALASTLPIMCTSRRQALRHVVCPPLPQPQSPGPVSQDTLPVLELLFSIIIGSFCSFVVAYIFMGGNAVSLLIPWSGFECEAGGHFGPRWGCSSRHAVWSEDVLTPGPLRVTLSLWEVVGPVSLVLLKCHHSLLMYVCFHPFCWHWDLETHVFDSG